jgi:hypothetical protein
MSNVLDGSTGRHTLLAGSEQDCTQETRAIRGDAEDINAFTIN